MPSNVIITVLMGAILTNVAFAMVSYDNAIRNGNLAYLIAILAGAGAAASWCLLVRNTPEKNQFFANITWDVGVTVLFLILPFIMYHLKIDMKSTIGAAVAVIGLLIMKI